MGTAQKFQGEKVRGAAVSRCTATIGTFSVGEIAACRAAGTIALHISTPAGRFIFRVSERDFVVNLRGAVDYNRNPFRSLTEIEAEAALDGTIVPRQAMARGEGTTRCERAWSLLISDPTLTVADVAPAWGVRAESLQKWISHHHKGELRALRAAAGLPLRATRRPAPLTLDRAPIAKPSGSLL